MTVHITARLAWHDDGWNGRICEKPAANTFCVGTYSYPGQIIAEKRKLVWETAHAGKPCKKLDDVPPCCYSMNAFGDKEIIAKAEPPQWFNKETKPRLWPQPASSIGTWPYEEMYGEDVRSERGFDAEQRLVNARNYFAAIEPEMSLVFYYSNYSNPFSEDEKRRYVLVGLSRVKSLGEELFYDGCSREVREKYGGNVWQRSITSHYPVQGLRIPYHLYRDNVEVLEKIVFFPENPRLCKYATRQISDDDALGLVEGFLRIVQNLREIQDTAEDWTVRTLWLETLISELWRHRGLYPGMCAVLEVLKLQDLIPRFKTQALKGKERDVQESVFSFLEGRSDSISGVRLDADTFRSTKRQWKLRTQDEQRLLKDVFPLFDLDKNQIQKILSENRLQNGIEADFNAISRNPYILGEQYEGDDPDDIIPWSTIDRGMIPSPEIGGKALAKPDDPRRLRALLVEGLRMEGTHTFVPADQLIESVNRRLSVLPEWKQFAFHLRYIDADEETLEEALYIRRAEERPYLYLRRVYEDERLLEQKLLYLIGGPDIPLRSPITEATWKGYLRDEASILAQKAEKEYRKAIGRQVEACQRIFMRPLGVLAGAAGTGKTTVIRALVKAIKRGHGIGASVIALAPTGKATDRIREVFENDESLKGRVEVVTLHSFLAKRKWLNPNMSFKRKGGNAEEGYSTYILDESSMLDLGLAAAFFRAVRWPKVQRLILVGDPNQLPPIGRGRVFADIIDQVRKNASESIATLEQNLRQLSGQLTGGGTGIIDLAQCYVQGPKEEQKNEDLSTAAEIVLQRVQEGGDVDGDLRILYWNDQEELQSILTEQIENDMREDVEKEGEDPASAPRDLWRQAVKDDPSRLQILSPYRGEFFGVDELNRSCQEWIRGKRPDGTDALGGIMLFDKVIQIRNRPVSWPIRAWNHEAKCLEKIEIFNGQLGFVHPHLFDKDKWKTPYFRLGRFRVVFVRREGYSIGYGKELGKGCPDESVEENLELAYAISVHKGQGSEFDRVYLVVPKSKQGLLSTEMFYTALTRARRHCTLLIEQDMTALLAMRRPECARLPRINASLFEFRPVPDELLRLRAWQADGLIHQTLADIMVRSKSEVIIANMLFERDIPFRYEKALYAPDRTFFLPDFTVTHRGTDYYWEHLGLLERANYKAHWKKKETWYAKHFPDRLIITKEKGDLSKQADKVIKQLLG